MQPHLQLPNLVSKDFIPLVSAQPTLLQVLIFLVCREHLSVVLLAKMETSILAGVQIEVQDLKEP